MMITTNLSQTRTQTITRRILAPTDLCVWTGVDNGLNANVRSIWKSLPTVRAARNKNLYQRNATTIRNVNIDTYTMDEVADVWIFRQERNTPRNERLLNRPPSGETVKTTRNNITKRMKRIRKNSERMKRISNALCHSEVQTNEVRIYTNSHGKKKNYFGNNKENQKTAQGKFLTSYDDTDLFFQLFRQPRSNNRILTN